MLHCRCYQRTLRSRSTRLDFKTICPFRMIHCVSRRGLFQGTRQSWNRPVTTLCWPILLEFLFHYAKDFKPLWDWSIASEREDGGLEGLDVAVGELKSALSDILTNQPSLQSGTICHESELYGLFRPHWLTCFGGFVRLVYLKTGQMAR